jgi:hypothetical protein
MGTSGVCARARGFGGARSTNYKQKQPRGAVSGCRARQCDVALALLVDQLILTVPRSAVRMAGAPSANR